MKKLVRDKIPEIIREQGITPEIEYINNDNEYFSHLKNKLLEEVNEFNMSENTSKQKEELSDIFEVIDAILKFKEFNIEEIKQIQKEKFNKRGGFDKRILATIK